MFCKPGTFSNTGLEPCNSCPTGTYQVQYGSIGCVRCPNGKTTATVGTTRIDDCKGALVFCYHLCLYFYAPVLEPCPSGTFSADGLVPCLLCPKGYYQEKVGQETCAKCPKSLVNKRTGSSSRFDCIRKWIVLYFLCKKLCFSIVLCCKLQIYSSTNLQK